ncbi:olfactory receptor 1D2-like [Myripristis murdjan]|uniref:Olfactory receptor n=1 Tax=Myripristis murdjan TaxID=586833 RepID=A0A667ZJU2_9TELE|nr:olfactory receptor 1D2-like [Myripristis murdjan]
MMDNVSALPLLTLSGITHTLEQRIILFLLSLLWYLVILLGNVVVVCIIIMDKSLHEPMYIFLCNLCINGLYGTVGFYPKFLLDLLSSPVISYAECLLQGFVIHSSTCSDLSILAIMAYDRYVAICRPLVYHSIMTKQRISAFLFFSWFIPLFCMFMNTASILGVPLCGSHINKIYCVNWMVVQLACTTPKANYVIAYFNILFYFLHAVFIFLTYMCLIRSCLSSQEKRGKFMQTCVPHLISLITFIAAILLDLLYMRFGSTDLPQDLQNFMAIEILVIPPVMNPFIYGFRLTKIRNRILSLFHTTRKDVKCQEQTFHITG